MSLSKLVFPLTLVTISFVVIVFIKPVALSVVEKVDQKESKASELQAVERTKQNIGALASEYETVSTGTQGTAVYEYLPVSASQERIVRLTNYAAAQSGIVVDGISFDEKGPALKVMETPVVANPSDATVPTPPILSDPYSFDADVRVSGSYEGIKSFFERMAMVSQIHETSGISIERMLQRDDQGGTSSGVLVGSASLSFLYLPMESDYQHAYLLPVFTKDRFDLSSIGTGTDPQTAAGLTEPGTSGRANPFLP